MSVRWKMLQSAGQGEHERPTFRSVTAPLGYCRSREAPLRFQRRRGEQSTHYKGMTRGIRPVFNSNHRCSKTMEQSLPVPRANYLELRIPCQVKLAIK